MLAVRKIKNIKKNLFFILFFFCINQKWGKQKSNKILFSFLLFFCLLKMEKKKKRKTIDEGNFHRKFFKAAEHKKVSFHNKRLQKKKL